MSSEHQTPAQLAAADRQADVKAILIIFVALVAGAVHFASGWTF